MSSPPHPFSFLSFFLCPLSLVRPRRRLSPAPTAYCRGRRAQMAVKAGRSSAATPPGLRPLQQSSTTADLMVGSITTPVRYLSVFVSARALFRSRMLLSAGLATRSMARAMFASTYIRQLRSGLPRCCLHGRSRRRDGTHLWDGRSASADLRLGSTATHPTRPTHPRLGCRNSAQFRRYRVRVAPCGTRPCSR
jgi:hypothetical protein